MKKYDIPMVMPVALDRLWQILLSALDWVRTRSLCFFWGIERRGRLSISGSILVRTRHAGTIVLGDGVLINSRKSQNLVGLSGPTILDTRGGGFIFVGDRSGMSSVVLSSHSKIEIGKRVKLGGNVRILDHDFHSLESGYRCDGTLDRQHIRTSPICIGNDVFVGTNSIILKGTKIGDRSIVAAGSVVFGLDIPADSLVKGNPAVVISKLRDNILRS